MYFFFLFSLVLLLPSAPPVSLSLSLYLSLYVFTLCSLFVCLPHISPNFFSLFPQPYSFPLFVSVSLFLFLYPTASFVSLYLLTPPPFLFIACLTPSLSASLLLSLYTTLHLYLSVFAGLGSSRNTFLFQPVLFYKALE